MAENTNEPDPESYHQWLEIVRAQRQAAVADQKITNHEIQCRERHSDLRSDIEKLDRNINTMSGRWFGLSASGIATLLAIIGYLLTNDVILSQRIQVQNPPGASEQQPPGASTK